MHVSENGLALFHCEPAFGRGDPSVPASPVLKSSYLLVSRRRLLSAAAHLGKLGGGLHLCDPNATKNGVLVEKGGGRSDDTTHFEE